MPLYIGLISGTSVDSIDAALVECQDNSARVVHTLSHPFPPDLQAQLLSMTTASTYSPEAVGQADARLGERLGQAALALIEDSGVTKEEVRAIGSHGQTVRHRPDPPHPFTWQLGDANRIAECTGITVVADFRRRDMAAGGQGAPLAPALHQAVFRRAGENRAVLNLGGIANLTLLPADPAVPATGFDTGPANGLLDHWHETHRGLRYDAEGQWAATGRVNSALLNRLLDDPYFDLPPPKSTGREHFNGGWLQERLGSFAEAPENDVQATLCMLTASSVAQALTRWMPLCQRLFVCGGGIHNHQLLRDLQAALSEVRIESTAALGIDPDWVEAAAFAWLAHRTLEGLAGNLPAVTGAHHPVVLGAIYPGKPASSP